MPISCTRNFFERFCVEDYNIDNIKQSSFLSADLLPSLGARINHSTKLPWEMWLVLLVIYSAWICPFQFAFITYKKDAIFIIDNIVNGFFAIDIVLTFFVAYLDSHSYLLVDDPKKIAIRYLSTWFAFDVCSTAPFQPLSLLFNYNGSELGFRILSMLRLWRLRRVSSLFARLEKDIRFNYFWIRCTKLISKLRGQQSIGIDATNNDQQNRDFQRMGWEEWMDSRIDCKGSDVSNSTSENGEKALMDAIHKGDIEMVKKLLKRGINIEEQKVLTDAKGGNSNSETKQRSNDSDQCCSSSIQAKVKDKRVTIHMLSQENDPQRHNGKLILLPTSIEKLLGLAGEKFGGCSFTKITNAENAEIDDLCVIRDGDHLFFHQIEFEGRN
ncbi:hypothetical protein F2Q70_00031458 [Brassica cretica]|uniref:KHA domain-containing protein n=1 Tax=Brassica cretica TaxID=69181 RepID=A0A8S9FGI1_BRACR|nr:hypothetical protein F2Q70_00031458 [Brassica cretica]